MKISHFPLSAWLIFINLVFSFFSEQSIHLILNLGPFFGEDPFSPLPFVFQTVFPGLLINVSDNIVC